MTSAGARRVAALAILVLLSLGGLICSAQGTFQGAPPDLTDVLLASGLVGRYLVVLPTTPLVVAGVQTPPWTVTATVVVVRFPLGADAVDASAIGFREVGTAPWQTTGSIVKQAGDSGEAFDVEYRIDLRALGDGAGGTYAFDITYQLDAGGTELKAVVVRLSVTAGEVVSLSLSGAIDDLLVGGGALLERYVALTGDLDVVIYAVTNYRVAVSCTVDGSADEAGLLVQSSSDIQVLSNPSGGVINVRAGLVRQPIRDDPWLFTQSFIGTNAAGQSSVARVGFWIDLDAIGNGTSGATRAIVATFTVTEE